MNENNETLVELLDKREKNETKKLSLSWQNLNVELTSQPIKKPNFKNLKEIFTREKSEAYYRKVINNGNQIIINV